MGARVLVQEDGGHGQRTRTVLKGGRIIPRGLLSSPPEFTYTPSLEFIFWQL